MTKFALTLKGVRIVAMKIFLGSALVLSVFGLSACGVQPESVTPSAAEKTVSEVVAQPSKTEHYVRIVLPAKETSKGALVTVNMQDRDPIEYAFAKELDLNDPSALVHVFEIESPLTPSTMTVVYNDGSSHTMSQVIFDTTIETP